MTATLRKLFEKNTQEDQDLGHTWAMFFNPRNGRVRINGCTQCGYTKDQAADMSPCQGASETEHLFQRMGWEASPF